MSYTVVGFVNFPVHNSEYIDSRSGCLSVRLLVEDLTLNSEYDISVQTQPTLEDALVGSDSFSGKDLKDHLSLGDRKMVRNILLGSCNWSGTRKREDGLYEMFTASYDDLEDEARSLVESLRSSMVGCQFYLVTSFSNKMETIESLTREAKELKLPVKTVPHNVLVKCSTCSTVKPDHGSKRLGWVKSHDKSWSCPEHVSPKTTTLNSEGKLQNV